MIIFYRHHPHLLDVNLSDPVFLIVKTRAKYNPKKTTLMRKEETRKIEDVNTFWKCVFRVRAQVDKDL